MCTDSQNRFLPLYDFVLALWLKPAHALPSFSLGQFRAEKIWMLDIRKERSQDELNSAGVKGTSPLCYSEKSFYIAENTTASNTYIITTCVKL